MVAVAPWAMARAATLRCVVATALGTPLEPEVDITYARQSGWISISGAASETSAGSARRPPPGAHPCRAAVRRRRR